MNLITPQPTRTVDRQNLDRATEPEVLGPLVTPFSMPSNCWVFGQSNRTSAWLGQGCSNGFIVDTTTCWPPPDSRVSRPVQAPLFGWGFYSPGLKCPVSYTSACTAVANGNGVITSGAGGWGAERNDDQPQWPMLADETAVGCCPTSFTCAGGGANTCERIATSTSILAGSCTTADDTLIDGLAYQTYPDGSNPTSVTLYAPLIQLNWRSQDLPVTVTATTTVEPAQSSASSAAPTSASSAATEGGPGLSDGAKAGIGVGVGLAGLLMIVLGILFFVRRRKQRPRFEDVAYNSGPGISQQPSQDQRKSLKELSAKGGPSYGNNSELSSQAKRGELDGDPTHRGELHYQAAKKHGFLHREELEHSPAPQPRTLDDRGQREHTPRPKSDPPNGEDREHDAWAQRRRPQEGHEMEGSQARRGMMEREAQGWDEGGGPGTATPVSGLTRTDGSETYCGGSPRSELMARTGNTTTRTASGMDWSVDMNGVRWK